MLVSCLFVLIGFGLLIYGADVFVDSASNIARLLGLPPLIIGLTIVGFATSAPEIIVGAVSAWQDKTVIAIGNALGSNITNIGLVLGLSILVIPVHIGSSTIKKEYGLMCVAILIGLLTMLDGHLSKVDGAILLLSLLVFLSGIVWLVKHSTKSDPLTDEFTQEFSETKNKPLSLGRAFATLLFGLFVLLLGADLLIRGSITIAQFFALPELVIGLTIVAIGTSLPELAASIVCLKKDEADIAVGNIIGSNMFNMLAVLGIPALINPTSFSSEVLSRDFPSMIVLSILLGIMLFAYSRGKLARGEGAILLLLFFTYQYIIFSQSIPIN